MPKDKAGAQYRLKRLAKARAFVAETGVTYKSISRPELEHLYSELKLPGRELARVLGCAEGTARKLLKAHGIPMRPRGATRTSHWNVAFFKSWRPEMAWVLGLIFTDGYMHERSHNVRLALNDRETLVKVRKALEADEVQISPMSTGQTIEHINFSSKPMCDDLRRLGVTQAKSFSIRWPNMPVDCERHFIRGCWDGDGGLSLRGDRPQAYYTSGSEAFVTKIRDRLFGAGVCRLNLRRDTPNRSELIGVYGDGPYPLRIYARKTQNSTFDLRISGYDNFSKLFHFLYNDVPGSLRMERKYRLFVEALAAHK